MSEKDKTLEVEKQEIASAEDQERTRDCRCYIPRSDISETEDKVTVIADMPGVDETSVEITLEKNTLTIRGYVEPKPIEGHSLSYAEYGVGDYERKFVLSNEIDRDNIEASVKNGVLYLVLPKSDANKTRKIEVKAA